MMPVEIKVPTLGESITEATVARWLKHEGDQVTEGESVVELETEKVNMEVPATSTGVLQSIVKHEGDSASVDDVLAIVAEGDTSAQTSAPVEAATESSAPLPTNNGQREATIPVLDDASATRATPLAKRMASEHNIDIASIRGTGPSGRVTKEDVNGYLSDDGRPPALQAPPAVAAPASTIAGSAGTGERREERVRMTRRRQTIARRLVEAQQTAAMLTTFNEVDMSAIMEVRKRRRDAFKERHGVGLGFMSFFTKAVVGALKNFPRLNAEIQGDEMILKHYYDIGIAVGADEGLVVPVVHDADRLSFAEIEREIAALATKARDNQLGMADLQGGTFTITNGGTFGSLLSTPILNAPQVGILGMHKIEQRPIALNGEVVIRPMMYLAMSYDHRIVDGSEAVRFLVRVKELLEDPETLLLEG